MKNYQYTIFDQKKNEASPYEIQEFVNDTLIFIESDNNNKYEN